MHWIQICKNNIRRGNTYIEVYDRSDYNLYKYIKLARKGLMKFYDLKPSYLVTDEDFRLSFKSETDKSKNSKKNNEMNIESNLRNYIFSGIMKSLNDGAYIEVVKTLKINGENAQISWVKEEQVWWIASKNVGILQPYFSKVSKIFQTWFLSLQAWFWRNQTWFQ